MEAANKQLAAFLTLKFSKSGVKINKMRYKAISDEKVVKTSIKVDIVDVLLNSVAALITGSVTMLAEAFQGIADLISDSLTYLGMRRGKGSPTKKYPFGYGRELYLWSFLSTLTMFLLLAGLSFYFGWQRFRNPQEIEHISLAYAILAISLLTNSYSFSLSFRRILEGRPLWQIKKAFFESTFLETKITFTSDLLGALAAFSGLTALILFEITGNLWLDGLGAMVIALIMALFSIQLLKNVKDLIVGVSASEETKNLIKKSALEVEGVKEVLDLKAAVIGSNRLLVNLEIHIQSGLVTEEIEKLIDKVKANVKEKAPSVYHIQVEPETPAAKL